MTDSLVLGGIIELLGGGQASAHPQCPGAYFRLGTGFDLSAPQLTAEQTAGLLLDGEVITGLRASNRTPAIPVTMYVLPTGDEVADRATLAGARELLLQVTSQETWEMVWTRDGAEPLIFDCFGLSSTVVHYSIRTEEALFSLVDVTFQAFPYGRSDTPETLVFNAPAAVWPAPPSTVTLDDFTIAYSFITGDNSGFEGGLGTWVGAGNCTAVRTTAQARTGAGSMQMTSGASGNMDAAHCGAVNITTQGMPCRTGDTISAKAWLRSAVSARTCQVGAQFYDASGTIIGSTLFGTGTADTTSGWTQVTAAVTAPSGSAFCRAIVRVQSTGAASEVHYADDITLDRGPVYSSVDPTQWTRSSASAQGSFSAFWSRVSHDNPIYDRTSLATWDITGRAKFTFWFGLATTSSQWPVWHKGNVHFAITLYDSTGASLSFGAKRRCMASALANKPHWQFISVHIPQTGSGFDYTQVTRYVISAWNTWDARARTGALQTLGGVALQASAYLNLVQAAPTATGTPLVRGAWYTLPGIVGTARAALAIQCAPGPSSFSTVVEFTTPGSNAWSAPAGLTKVDKAEAWGTGAGGAGNINGPGDHGGGGGGAGEYAMEINVPVTALGSYPATVGAIGTGGSSGNPGNPGGDSFWFGNSGQGPYANGGHPGWASSTWGGGKGGSGSNNYVHYDGGNGRQSNINSDDGNPGGGGGGSGGKSGPGHDADGRQGAAAVSDGGPGGDGGRGPSDSAPHNGHAPSTGPGGGGGGGADNAGGQSGGAGKAGKVRLTYGASGLLPLASLLVHAPGEREPDAFNPLVPLGAGTDVPNGATEYTVPDIGNLNARYDGTYSLYLIAGTWNSPASSRNLTVQLRQYPYTGGAMTTLNVVRNGVVPNTDITNGYVDMGPVTLPLNALSPGGLDSYFALTVTSSNTADRFLDVLIISTQGSLVLVNVPGSSVWNNIWLDPPDADRNLGLILGSPADRDQASSLLQYVGRFAGGPLSVSPDHNNRLLVYSAQGAPALTATYSPAWWTERLA